MPSIPEPTTRAIAYARKQLGKEYVFGASGPMAFDCSGLMMRAWEQGGVELPHNSLQQSSVTSRVVHHTPRLTLTPGDLVFYYLPISHVGMYIGRDKWGRKLVLQATSPQRGIEIITMYQFAKPVLFGRVKYAGWESV